MSLFVFRTALRARGKTGDDLSDGPSLRCASGPADGVIDSEVIPNGAWLTRSWSIQRVGRIVRDESRHAPCRRWMHPDFASLNPGYEATRLAFLP